MRSTFYVKTQDIQDVTLDGTVQQLPDIPCHTLNIKHQAGGTGVKVATSAARLSAGEGWPLAALGETGFWPCKNASDFFVLGTNTEKISLVPLR